jgi:TRAP-type C4-dicarboxylate transport system substrate-binding protein
MKYQKFAGAVALSLGMLASSAFAADHVIKLSLDIPEGHPKHMAATQFAKEVAEKTNNAI